MRTESKNSSSCVAPLGGRFIDYSQGLRTLSIVGKNIFVACKITFLAASWIVIGGAVSPRPGGFSLDRLGSDILAHGCCDATVLVAYCSLTLTSPPALRRHRSQKRGTPSLRAAFPRISDADLNSSSARAHANTFFVYKSLHMLICPDIVCIMATVSFKITKFRSSVFTQYERHSVSAQPKSPAFRFHQNVI